MRIALIGSGVVGATFGWQLTEAGHHVEVIDPMGRPSLRSDGITIACLDQRRRLCIKQARFVPPLRSAIDPDEPPDLLLVCVQRHQREAVMPTLATLPATMPILFLQQQWADRAAIEHWLTPAQYLLGFPALGGGRDPNGIFCWLLPEATVIGSPDGKPNALLYAAVRTLRSAQLTVQIDRMLTSLLDTRAIVRTVIAAAAIKAGSVGALSNSSEALAETALAIREGLDVCAAANPAIWHHPYTRMYRWRLAEVVHALGRTLQRPRVRCALGGCIAHTLDELRGIANDVVRAGGQAQIEPGTLAMLSPWLDVPYAIDRFVSRQPENKSLPRPTWTVTCGQPCAPAPVQLELGRRP
ncbi:MAG: hypothetical protein EOM24_00125 [Chloroflexia bacterium]|nr:hypothetical protein [Chloroflexia bacterium]